MGYHWTFESEADRVAVVPKSSEAGLFAKQQTDGSSWMAYQGGWMPVDGGVYTLTSDTTITPNANYGRVFLLTLEDNTTLEEMTNHRAGQTYIYIITQDGTGSRTMAFDSAYKFAAGSAPTLSTAAGAVDVLTFVSDGTSLYGAAQLGVS